MGRHLTVKDLDVADQPREKAMAHGCGVLSTADLWALILRTGTPGTPITELCRQLMNDNEQSLHRLERRTRKELLAIKGIGLTKAIQIEAVMELIRRYTDSTPASRPLIKSSADSFRLLRYQIGNLDHEEIWALFLNKSLHVIGQMKLSQGGTDASVFDVKLLLKQALLENSSALILAHNHPSGNLNPSRPDDNITQICARACEAVSIRFLDHIIVTASGYYSYSDKGRMAPPGPK